jgi:hypothetical protein
MNCWAGFQLQEPADACVGCSKCPRTSAGRKALSMDTPQGTPVSPAAPSTAPGPTTAPAPKRRRASGGVSPAVAVTVASAVLVVAALALARYSAQPAAPGAASTESEPAPPVPLAAAQPDALPTPLAAPLPGAAQVAITKPRQARVGTARKSSPGKSVTPPRATEAAASEPGESVAKTLVPEPPPSAPAADSNHAADRVSQAPVTITGCLETTIKGDRFRLTDTEGAEAPKARSWRSGFLRKRPAPVELLELPDMAGLRNFVGHRVAATGLLTSRELRVRSLGSAGPSCN